MTQKAIDKSSRLVENRRFIKLGEIFSILDDDGDNQISMVRGINDADRKLPLPLFNIFKPLFQELDQIDS